MKAFTVTIRMFLDSLEIHSKDEVEGVKEYLRVGNRGMRIPLVENCTKVSLKTLEIASVRVGNIDHYNRVEARAPKSLSSPPVIYGVVVQEDNRYHLVDGYHRLKYAKQHGTLNGLFLVLSKAV